MHIIFEGAVNLLQFQWQAFFLSAAVADIRFRTPVGSINVPPSFLEVICNGSGGTVLFSACLQLIYYGRGKDLFRN